MVTVALGLLVFLAALHLWFMVLETFLWTKPLGRKTFRMSAEQAAATAVLAGNQGIYNGILAAGLLFAAFVVPAPASHLVQLFFAGAVVVAGLYGGATASRAIFVVQALPGALAVAALLVTG